MIFDKVVVLYFDEDGDLQHEFLSKEETAIYNQAAAEGFPEDPTHPYMLLKEKYKDKYEDFAEICPPKQVFYFKP